MQACIINEWPASFTEKYQHHLPTTYMAVDSEFTGSDVAKDLVFEIGHVLVVDGSQIDAGSVILDWTKHPGIDQNWLKYKLNHLRGYMGDTWPFTWEKLRDEGVEPKKALEQYATLIGTWKQRGLPFVAHNGITADERILRAMFERFLRRGNFRFPDNAYFDTGAIFKASLMLEQRVGDQMIIFPQPDDSLKTYFQRVIHHPVKGVMWSMKSLLSHFKLQEKHDIDSSLAHTASHDARCVHLAVEEFRSMVYRNNSGESPADSGAAMQRAFEADAARQRLETATTAAPPARRGELRRKQRPL